MNGAEANGKRVVVVCDRHGNAVGSAGVLEVHQGRGVLHKAFSILVFRRAGSELLLQQRSHRKALFPMRWANTCCSHPAPDDGLLSAATRRLQEEFGFSVALREAGSFVYRATDAASALTEYEHDTVLIGSAGDAIAPRPDPDEIAAWRLKEGWAIDLVDAVRQMRLRFTVPDVSYVAVQDADGIFTIEQLPKH